MSGGDVLFCTGPAGRFSWIRCGGVRLRGCAISWFGGLGMTIRVFERADSRASAAERYREAHSTGYRRHVQFCTDRTACACYCESASQAGRPP